VRVLVLVLAGLGGMLLRHILFGVLPGALPDTLRTLRSAILLNNQLVHFLDEDHRGRSDGRVTSRSQVLNSISLISLMWK
jgi:hypothetical protein